MNRAAAQFGWEMTLLDGGAPSTDLASLAVGDLDGDGRLEIVTAGGVLGDGALLWYRPATAERGVISYERFSVGIGVADVDRDGALEVVAACLNGPNELVWFKPETAGALDGAWVRHVIDPERPGSAHDLLFVDVDGDGEDELVANDISQREPSLCVYKRGDDPAQPWLKHFIQKGSFEEGLACGDFDGDGRIDIASGPNWYACPASGAFSEPWRRGIVAPSFREMSRNRAIDVNGDGIKDLVIVESEYLEGRLSWFENRIAANSEAPWIEHIIDDGLVYGHSLAVRREPETGALRIFVAEMAHGGFGAPPNRKARLLEYVSEDNGKTWSRQIMYQGAGTHEAVVIDIDGDGRLEVVGKQWRSPTVQIWKEASGPSPLAMYQHRFLDLNKPASGTDILACDVDGDGRPDVVCGSWWYANPSWERRAIPGIQQVVNAYDIDGDGRDELIATKGEALSAEMYWLKAVDPKAGRWEEHYIGTGIGDWPHGTVVAPLLPGGRLALVAAYHSAHARKEGGERHFPEIFEVPDDPRQPWRNRVLAEIRYGEEIVSSDIDGDGLIDLVAGFVWLRNRGDGTFEPRPIVADTFYPARVAVADLNGDGLLDVVLGEEVLDFQNKHTPLSRLAWFENPGPEAQGPWKMHVVDQVRCAHSVSVADLDGDGADEIICGEHDPFLPYRTECRLLVYKRQDTGGLTWARHVLDDRFEHHDGAKVFEVSPGRKAIISHGWKDVRYVHLWEQVRPIESVEPAKASERIGAAG